jgi:hypothetical protein
MDRQLAHSTGSPATDLVRRTRAGMVSLALALALITFGATPASAATNTSAPAASAATADLAIAGQESVAAAKWIYYADYYSRYDCERAGYNKLMNRQANNYRCVYVSRGHWVAWALYLYI